MFNKDLKLQGIISVVVFVCLFVFWDTLSKIVPIKQAKSYININF